MLEKRILKIPENEIATMWRISFQTFADIDSDHYLKNLHSVLLFVSKIKEKFAFKRMRDHFYRMPKPKR